MSDKLTLRMIVGFMGAVALAVVGGIIWLADHGKTLTDAGIALGGVALGNLGTFLVSTHGSNEPAAVEVVNPPAAPVPVEPAGD